MDVKLDLFINSRKHTEGIWEQITEKNILTEEERRLEKTVQWGAS
jgi:hypothetical protein